MFKSSILTTAYEDVGSLLQAIADNLVYSYGVSDQLGDIQLDSLVTKKSTEAEPVTTAIVPSPTIKTLSDMVLPSGYVAMVTGRVDGSPALAYVSNDWLGASNINATIASNLAMLAEAMGYESWFIAPHLTSVQEFIPGNPHQTVYTVGLSGQSSPFAVSVTTASHNLPCFVLDVPANPPHGADASWSQPADYDRLVDYMRSNSFEIIRRYYGQDNQQHIVLSQRHYVTDLENVQDVLRQICIASVTDIAQVAHDLADEASSRTAADQAMTSVLGSMAVFGSTFKQVVDASRTLDHYIPRP